MATGVSGCSRTDTVVLGHSESVTLPGFPWPDGILPHVVPGSWGQWSEKREPTTDGAAALTAITVEFVGPGELCRTHEDDVETDAAHSEEGLVFSAL